MEIPAGLPRGRGALAHQQVLYIQRMRILDALLELAAEHGVELAVERGPEPAVERGVELAVERGAEPAAERSPESAAERGLRAISVAEVSARAGVSRSTFYRVFTSKRQALLVAGSHRPSTAAARLAWALPHQSQRGLRFICEHPGASSQTVRAGLGFRHLSQASRTLARLERLGLAHTPRSPGRPHAWLLTALGEEVLQALDRATESADPPVSRAI